MSLVQNHQVSILVVDPNAEVRGQVHEVLLSDGYGCRAVASAPAAIQSAKEKTPSLLLCDMNLGDHTGLDLLREMTKFADCPVIFMSDSRDASMVRHARQAGATFYLTKPFDIDVLMELVDKALWMPHLVKRHVESAAHSAHQVKPPTFSIGTSATPKLTS